MSAHFEIWFSKKRTIKFKFKFKLSKLSKLHKKDPILHVATTFSLKQGETRTSHGPIPHPLIFHRGCVELKCSCPMDEAHRAEFFGETFKFSTTALIVHISQSESKRAVNILIHMRQKGNKICICLWYDNVYTGIETRFNIKGCILNV